MAMTQERVCDIFPAMPAAASAGKSAAVTSAAAATRRQPGAQRGHADGCARTAADGDARRAAAQSVRRLQDSRHAVVVGGARDGHRHVQHVLPRSRQQFAVERVPLPAAAARRSRPGETWPKLEHQNVHILHVCEILR